MTKKEETKNLPSKAQVEKFEMLFPMIYSILTEMKEFAKRKQDGQLNELKVRTINKVLEQVKDILSDEPIADFLELLEDETLPTNSDAVLIITEYTTAMTQFKSKYYFSGGIEIPDNILSTPSRWKTKENP